MSKISPGIIPSTLVALGLLANGCQSSPKAPEPETQAVTVPSDYAQELLQENKPQEFKTELTDPRQDIHTFYRKHIKETYQKQSKLNAAIREIKIKENNPRTTLREWAQLEKSLKEKGFELEVKDFRILEISLDGLKEKMNAEGFIKYLVRANFAQFTQQAW